MTTLGSLAKLIRSKNAGPFQLTIDVMFDDPQNYRRVLDSKVITADSIGKLLGIDRQLVRIFEFDPAMAIKATVPRTVSVGDPLDSDLFGGQLFGPLVDLEVP
jgi:Domain of unknown function (DUF4387)